MSAVCSRVAKPATPNSPKAIDCLQSTSYTRWARCGVAEPMANLNCWPRATNDPWKLLRQPARVQLLSPASVPESLVTRLSGRHGLLSKLSVLLSRPTMRSMTSAFLRIDARQVQRIRRRPLRRCGAAPWCWCSQRRKLRRLSRRPTCRFDSTNKVSLLGTGCWWWVCCLLPTIFNCKAFVRFCGDARVRFRTNSIHRKIRHRP